MAMTGRDAKLSLATIAWDEEQSIHGLLSSMVGVVDEVVIGIDSRTTDRTREIVEQWGGKTFMFDWCDDFSAARNLSLDHATHDWVLVLDPDERLTRSGAVAINDIMSRVTGELAHVDGFFFVYCDIDLDGQPQHISHSSIRLFRRIPEIRYRGLVHEQPVGLNGKDPTWFVVSDVVTITTTGHDPKVIAARGKHERNKRLLEMRLAADPNDQWAKTKLAETLQAL